MKRRKNRKTRSPEILPAKCKHVASYEGRNKLLKLLGFATYGDYLASDLWKRVRSAAWKEHGDKCRLCSQAACEVHHLDYSRDTLIGTRLRGLVPLCRECHQKVEFRNDGKKRDMTEALHVYSLLLGERCKQELSKCGCGNAAKRGQSKCRRCLRGETATPTPSEPKKDMRRPPRVKEDGQVYVVDGKRHDYACERVRSRWQRGLPVDIADKSTAIMFSTEACRSCKVTRRP